MAKCIECGAEKRGLDELYYGFCEGCLRKKCDYDTALEFLKSQTYLGPFFCWLLNDGYEPPAFYSYLLDAFEELYRRKVANDKLLSSTSFLGIVQQYILDLDGDYGKMAFARFLRGGEH